MPSLEPTGDDAVLTALVALELTVLAVVVTFVALDAVVFVAAILGLLAVPGLLAVVAESSV